MSVHARSEHPAGAAAARRLRSRGADYLAALGRPGAEVSVLVVGDAAIRRLNRAWRGIDRPTDVLSFPGAAAPAGAAARGAGEGAAPFLGDVAISLDTARREARRRGVPVGRELDRYLAHALLHLLGHEHHRPAEARRMAAAEDALVGEGLVSAARRPAAPARAARRASPGGPRGGRRSPRRERGRAR